MTDTSKDQIVYELRGQVSVLNDGLSRLADRVDAIITGKMTSRRFTITTIIATAMLVLTALGLIGGLIFATI
jgi:hypothetical protein